jgi:kynureninase
LSELLVALAPPGLELASPRDPARRGGFVAFRCRDAKKLLAALERRRVVASTRPPDILRFGLSPLYHRESDVRELARRLRPLL